jgi:FKBP-type peptidyl-prolyl cis-trans isomerase FkpA
MKRIFLLLGLLTVLFSACKKTSFNDSKQAAIDDEKIQKYIAANNIDGLTKDPSGVYYKIITTNSGPHPTLTDTVQVSYTGKLLNGNLFDSETAAIVDMPTVIQGWKIGIPLLGASGTPAYGRIRLIIPSGLAYGGVVQSGGSGASIPINSCLDFTIDLIGFYN